MFRSFFHHGHMLKEVNRIRITLVLKINNPDSVSHYMPLVCNISYKFMSNILANRLEKVIPQILFPV